MTKKQTKKQPINVQLSKDDLKGLIVVLKDFIQEELLGTDRVHDHRLGCHNERLISLEGKERRREKRELNRILHCFHEDRLDRVYHSEITGAFLAAIYKCRHCGQENRKIWCFLTRKEKKALRKLGVIIK